MTTITLTPSELATVLAALRYWKLATEIASRPHWQREWVASGGAEMDIATDGGTLTPLDVDAIDSLCERINADSTPRIAVVMEGGTVQSIVTDTPGLIGTRIMVIDYDTDQASDDETIQVPQENGGLSRAMRQGMHITLGSIGLKEVEDTIEWEA
jgi:hypothetical protein